MANGIGMCSWQCLSRGNHLTQGQWVILEIPHIGGQYHRSCLRESANASYPSGLRYLPIAVILVQPITLQLPFICRKPECCSHQAKKVRIMDQPSQDLSPCTNCGTHQLPTSKNSTVPVHSTSSLPLTLNCRVIFHLFSPYLGSKQLFTQGELEADPVAGLEAVGVSMSFFLGSLFLPSLLRQTS